MSWWGTDRAHAYDAAVARLLAGEYIAILPEAGVSRSFTVRECKTGAVRMAAEAGVPIIPVSIWGAHRLMTRHHGFSPRRAWRAPVRIHVGEPILPGSLPDPAQDAQPATAELARTLQHGIDVGMADFPLQPAPGAWWMPAGLGGGAPTEEERRRLDEADGPRRAGARRPYQCADNLPSNATDSQLGPLSRLQNGRNCESVGLSG